MGYPLVGPWDWRVRYLFRHVEPMHSAPGMAWVPSGAARSEPVSLLLRCWVPRTHMAKSSTPLPLSLLAGTTR